MIVEQLRDGQCLIKQTEPKTKKRVISILYFKPSGISQFINNREIIYFGCVIILNQILYIKTPKICSDFSNGVNGPPFGPLPGTIWQARTGNEMFSPTLFNTTVLTRLTNSIQT